MGSLRNPVGPLPSSIYWRRRAVLLSLLALLVLLVTLIVVSGGGDGKGGGGDADGKNPMPSITPGPSGTGPVVPGATGGGDGSGGGDSGGGDSGGSGAGSGSGGGSGGASGGGSGGGSGDGASGGGAGSGSGSGGAGAGGPATGVGAGDVLAGGSALPDCAPGAVRISVRSVRNSYAPGQTPEFELTARNGSGADCKIDLGPEHTVLTITPASDDDAFWSSDDCPKGAKSLSYRVGAGSGIAYTVKWDRRPSTPECGTPPAGTAEAGTYLVEAKAPGFEKARTSFVLKAD
ncbi:hypothetical protein ACGFZL_03065 [Streptomyces sp. NPDC048182]|uniref:hypothetical protein n=1 Tax=Streptomyces sp. NPDC048182 TaxID=3365507 RepID=UPI0037191A92